MTDQDLLLRRRFVAISDDAPAEGPLLDTVHRGYIRHLRRRRRLAVGSVVVVVLLVAFGFHELSRDDDGGGGPSSADTAPRSRGTLPATPDEVPDEGLYVVSDVTDDGTVDVQTWLRAPQPITELKLTTTDPDLLPGSAESLDLVVRTMDGKLVAHRDDVGTNHQTIRLRAPATELFFTYTVDGGMDDATSTVQGRTLARILAMDVDYDGAAGGVVRRLVTAPGTVLNVACLRPRSGFQATPSPCGKPTGDGDWFVELQGADRGDRLIAQVEG